MMKEVKSIDEQLRKADMCLIVGLALCVIGPVVLGVGNGIGSIPLIVLGCIFMILAPAMSILYVEMLKKVH